MQCVVTTLVQKLWKIYQNYDYYLLSILDMQNFCRIITHNFFTKGF